MLGKKLWSDLRVHRVWRRGPFNNGQHLQFLTNTLSPALIARHWPSFLRGSSIFGTNYEPTTPPASYLRSRPFPNPFLSSLFWTNTHSYRYSDLDQVYQILQHSCVCNNQTCRVVLTLNQFPSMFFFLRPENRCLSPYHA